ncbi:MAG TPA: response regulator [Cyclobacteriaceae bacterium]
MTKSKLLLIDDREDNLMSIEAILEPAGYRFVKAQSGQEALRILLKEYDFSLILMDVRMPQQSGFETATMIYERDKLKHIPIIFITANNFGDEELFKGYQAGAVDYIYKPVHPDVLRAKVAVFVDLYEKNKRLQQQEKSLLIANQKLEKEVRERIASEQKIQKLNRQLMQNIEHLEAVNQELDRFAFMASHDLQEPLRKIRLFSSKFLARNRHNGDDSGVEDIDRIQKSAERMQRLIRDILTMAKVSGNPDDFEPTNLNDLIAEMTEEFSEKMEAQSARILVDKLPIVYVHPGLIRLLFRNLIANALKFAREDVQPLIRIYAEVPQHQNKESRNDFCMICVKDNGIGFDPHFSEEIFGMFTRLHPDHKEGTGLGLALCKRIVQHHRGNITATGNNGEGATFTFSLPRQGPSQKKKVVPAGYPYTRKS